MEAAEHYFGLWSEANADIQLSNNANYIQASQNEKEIETWKF